MSSLLYDSRESGGHCGSCTPPPRVPPFAPQPLLGPPANGHTAVTSSSSSAVTCNAHEVCHYFQQVLYVSAILTGIALVIAGAIQSGASSSVHPDEATPGSDLLVFVYIGALLIGVNVSLLMLQCYMRSKELKRARRNTQRARPVRYNPLVAPPPAPFRQASQAEVSSFLPSDSRLWLGPAPSVQSAATAPAYPGTQWPLIAGAGPASR
ncbi:uncharacterized protein LOC135391341 [Ornithodoros turicata]|uniref:uncharacterized protein LOC135373730 n=1 Tax=Ornithodoros turicata TaxID=34597 RepID=UPI003138987D